MDEWRGKNCLNYKKKSGVVKPQQVVEALYKVTGGDAFITSDVGNTRCGRRNITNSISRDGGLIPADWAPWVLVYRRRWACNWRIRARKSLV